MKIEDYDYNLPEASIAQEPSQKRDMSRLLSIDAGSETIEHHVFSELPGLIRENDTVVVNDTKVFPARLIGNKTLSGGEVEIFLLDELEDTTWNALSKPARRLKVGTAIRFGDGLLTGEILEKGDSGRVRIRFESDIPLHDAIDSVGKVPLPPYIRRAPVTSDTERYQTVYAKERGSVAAPTAGLHFSEDVLGNIKKRGAVVTSVTLHVGIGTFRPLNDVEAGGDTLHDEFCTVSESTVRTILERRSRGGRVIAVGTTTSRALESASRSGRLEPYEGWTNIFIKPPYEFKSVDCMVTNFHLPRSSLLMMVSAFAGREKMLGAYRTAIDEGYRFYSYGDAMFIKGRTP